MCDVAVDNSPAALKFISDWIVTSKMIKKLFTDLYADDNVIYSNENSGDIIFSGNETGIIVFMMKMALKLLFMPKYWLGIVNLEKIKHVTKS